MHLKSTFSVRSSSPPHWYFVKFHTLPDHSLLTAHSISLPPQSFISITSYNLYLTPAQATFLASSNLATLSELEDKLILSDLPLSSAHHLFIEVSDDFDPSAHRDFGLEFHILSPTVYSVHSADLPRAVSYLRTLHTVYAVTPASPPSVLNHLSVGYTQAHTTELQRDNSFRRPLHARGIQGNGTVITVIDTPLDTTSTFFYDSAPIGPSHRKLLYVHSFGQPMKVSEHGTHVCGSLAGNSADSDAAKFNGMAPMARIAYIPLEMVHAVVRDLASYMRSWGSHISTNSWGTAGYGPAFVRIFDEWAYANPDLTVVFSAGNDRARDWARLGGLNSVGSPASCKNVLSIGSLGQLPVSNPPDERTYLLALTDENPLQGVSLFTAKRMRFSADPFTDNTTRIASSSGQGPQYKVITTTNELQSAVSDPDGIQFVVTTVNIESAAPTPFGVFWVADPAFIQKNRTAYHIAVTQEFRVGPEFLGVFSSMGPTATGIVKPEVSAPGDLILSAKSSPVGPPNHDVNPLSLHLLSGTSMASPHVSGSLALVEQWLRDSVKLADPTSLLMRAIAVTCAEPINPAQKAPDTELGYGVLHLTKYLPMLGAHGNYRFIYLNSGFIPVPGHLVSRLAVVGRGHELRITVAYLDVSVSTDSRIPLFVDLDLVVVSPTGRVFRGNHYGGGHEEHFSTIERVILNQSDLEVGEYSIHILAIAPTSLPRVQFGVVAVGELGQTAMLKFEDARDCLDCGPGVCNQRTKLCDCARVERVGQSCQISPVVIRIGSGVESVEREIGPLGVLYVIFRNGEKNGSTLGLRVASVSQPVALRLFVGTAGHVARIPAEFGEVIWDNKTKSRTWERETPDREVAMMIRNDFNEPRKYRIWVERKSHWRIWIHVSAIIGGVVALAVVVFVGVVCYRRRGRTREKSSSGTISD